MFDRYIEHTREHQAELRLDAANQRLVAQARRSIGTNTAWKSTPLKVLGVFHGIAAPPRLRADGVRSC
jgi:hypothetical protein